MILLTTISLISTGEKACDCSTHIDNVAFIKLGSYRECSTFAVLSCVTYFLVSFKKLIKTKKNKYFVPRYFTAF